MTRIWPDPTPAGGPLPRPSHGRKPRAPKPHHSSGKSSSSASGSIVAFALAFVSLPLGLVAGVALYLLHGYGLI